MKPNEKVREALIKKSEMYGRVFEDGTEGAEILADLKRQFDPMDLFDPDPYVNAMNIGQRDTFKYIEALVNYRPKGDK